LLYEANLSYETKNLEWDLGSKTNESKYLACYGSDILYVFDTLKQEEGVKQRIEESYFNLDALLKNSGKTWR